MLLKEGVAPYLTSDIINRCKEVGIRTVFDFLSADAENLAQKISTPYKDISSIQRMLLAYYGSFVQSGDNLYEELLQSLSILNTGNEKLDEFLDGGIYTGEITEIYGLSGSGKTQFCLNVLCNLILETENTAFYMDTNCSFTSKRIEEILMKKSKNAQITEDAMKRLKVINVYDIYEVFNFLQQIKSEICKQEVPFYSSIKLIVLDSVAPLVSPCLGGPQFDGHGLMINLSQLLKSLCYEHALSVVVCNNSVYGNDSSVKSALGPFWKYVPSVTLCITKLPETSLHNSDCLKKLTAVKSCRKSISGDFILKFTSDGICAVSHPSECNDKEYNFLK